MNRNVLIALAGGLLVAVLVAVLLGTVLGSGKKKKKQVVQQEPRVEILVAAKDIAISQKLTKDNVKWKSWPKSAAFKGTVRRKDNQNPLEALEGRVNRKIAQGEPILTTAMLVKGGNYVAASLEPGMRAMAVKIGAEESAGGFVAPGDYVDVMLTYRKSIKTTTSNKNVKAKQKEIVSAILDKYATETILQNVKVLAIDQSAIRNEEKVKVGKTATLLVTLREAEILAVAEKAGNLSLALRGVGDDAIIARDEPIVTDERMLNIYDEIMEEFEKNLGGSGGLTSKNVVIYNGDKVLNLGVKKQ
jgi:pilus assembly protein CpaB